MYLNNDLNYYVKKYILICSFTTQALQLQDLQNEEKTG